MSAPQSCSPCCSTETTTAIPGPQGAAGADGANGVSSYSVTTSATTLPAVNSNVTVAVASSVWMGIGQVIFISDGTHKASLQVVSFPSAAAFVGKFLGYANDSVAAQVVALGATVSASGTEPALAGSLPASITDNSGATSGASVVATLGVFSIPIFVNLADLANANLITAYVLGYSFKILKMDFIVEKIATTAAKTVTLTPYIGGVAVTGGVVLLTTANCGTQGATVAGSAITALNNGSAAQTFTITGSSTTAFVEGSGWIVLTVQNTDTAAAVATMVNRINALIAALT